MKSSILSLAALATGVLGYANVSSSVYYLTTTVTALTTYCPGPTVLTHGSLTSTITEVILSQRGDSIGSICERNPLTMLNSGHHCNNHRLPMYCRHPDYSLYQRRMRNLVSHLYLALRIYLSNPTPVLSQPELVPSPLAHPSPTVPTHPSQTQRSAPSAPPKPQSPVSHPQPPPSQLPRAAHPDLHSQELPTSTELLLLPEPVWQDYSDLSLTFCKRHKTAFFDSLP